MTNRKYIVVALLLVVPLLAAAHTVQSQQYATTTFTTIVTGSGISTVAAGTQVLTTTQGQSNLIFSCARYNTWIAWRLRRVFCAGIQCYGWRGSYRVRDLKQ